MTFLFLSSFFLSVREVVSVRLWCLRSLLYGDDRTLRAQREERARIGKHSLPLLNGHDFQEEL
jgi:hypothetical protein